MEKLVSLAKRRGFFFQSSEIYGGIQGFWDFGPLGVTLRNNVKQAWWRAMVELRDDVVGIDASIIRDRLNRSSAPPFLALLRRAPLAIAANLPYSRDNIVRMRSASP